MDAAKEREEERAAAVGLEVSNMSHKGGLSLLETLG
jgi:hypothetical protein